MGDKTGQRLFTSSIFVLIAMIGMIMVIAIPAEAPAGRLIGYYLTLACPAGFVAILSLISTNVAGYTKKTTVAALYLIAYCVVVGISSNVMPMKC
jgi:ACS family allantoate permease-like MFS transporter